MNRAMGAGMRAILGATLVAQGLPVLADTASSSGSIQGIDQADIRRNRPG